MIRVYTKVAQYLSKSEKQSHRLSRPPVVSEVKPLSGTLTTYFFHKKVPLPSILKQAYVEQLEGF